MNIEKPWSWAYSLNLFLFDYRSYWGISTSTRKRLCQCLLSLLFITRRFIHCLMAVVYIFISTIYINKLWPSKDDHITASCWYYLFDGWTHIYHISIALSFYLPDHVKFFLCNLVCISWPEAGYYIEQLIPLISPMILRLVYVVLLMLNSDLWYSFFG